MSSESNRLKYPMKVSPRAMARAQAMADGRLKIAPSALSHGRPTALGRPVEETDWEAVSKVLLAIQSAAPLDPNWVDHMPKDFQQLCEQARRVLLQTQMDGSPVPESVWAEVIPSSRAALLRNTITGCLSAYRRYQP